MEIEEQFDMRRKKSLLFSNFFLFFYFFIFLFFYFIFFGFKMHALPHGV